MFVTIFFDNKKLILLSFYLIIFLKIYKDKFSNFIVYIKDE